MSLLLSIGPGAAHNKHTYRNNVPIAFGDTIEGSMTARKEADQRNPAYTSTTTEALISPRLTKGAQSAIPKHVRQDRQVLRFNAYFLEPVFESAQENHRVRKCDIFFHLACGEIHISEPKEENSGIPQGQFIRRVKVPKEEGGGYLTEDDLKVGAKLLIFGRTFFIVDCDEQTRKKTNQPPGIAYPSDSYTQIRQAKKARDTGANQDIHRGKKQNPLKKFMEASLGNVGGRGDGLARFKDNEGKVLRFFGQWDDTSLHGFKRAYKVLFYLADETMSVLEVPKANNGVDPFPYLLSRSKVPRVAEVSMRADETDDDSFYKERDLAVGQTVLIFNREILLYAADDYTYEHYQTTHGLNMRANEIDVAEPAKPQVEHTIPKHSNTGCAGFGSEADSKSSCNSLIPKAPRKHVNKLLQNEGKMLRFNASMVTTSPLDTDRSFIIKLFLSDDTVEIFEVPSRNAGRTGGRTRARGPIDLPTSDFGVGKVVVFNGIQYLLSASDDYTQTMMEIHDDSFPDSSFAKIARQIRDAIGADGVADILSGADKDGDSSLSPDEFKDYISAVAGVELSEQQLMTLFRRFDCDKSGSISLAEFSATLENGEIYDEGPVTSLNGPMTLRQIELYVNKLDASTLTGKQEISVECAMKNFMSLLTSKNQGMSNALNAFCSTINPSNAETMSVTFFKKQMKDKVNWLPHESSLVVSFFLGGSEGAELNPSNFLKAVVQYQEAKKQGRYA